MERICCFLEARVRWKDEKKYTHNYRGLIVGKKSARENLLHSDVILKNSEN